MNDQKRPNIRTAYNYIPCESSFEHPEGESKTVPDMTLSLKTLVERYTRSGQLGDVATFTPVYLGEAEVLPIERMTPQERLDYARAIREDIKDMREQMAQRAQPDPEPQPEPAPAESEREGGADL